jgi:hypothetical protein
LEEWSSEELTESMQLMISWLIRSSQVDSCIITLQTSAMSRGCFTSYKLAWDPGDFTHVPIFGFPHFVVEGTFMACQWRKRSKKGVI